MKLSANIDFVKLIDWHINTGEVNARSLDVEMSEELKQCSVAFVTFKTENEGTYESKVNNGAAEIPCFSESQWVEIGLYTSDMVNGELKKRYSPKPAKKFIKKGSFSPGSSEPPKPTPGDYAELLEQIAGVKEDNAEAIAELEKGTIKVMTEKVNLWELETGIYYLEGGFYYKTDLASSNKDRHIFLIYKPTSKKAVRYIHFCGDYQKDVWSSIACGYTDGNTQNKYSILDSTKTTSDITKDTMGVLLPNSTAVKKYVGEVKADLEEYIDEIKTELKTEIQIPLNPKSRIKTGI